jgi:hypothetical protein
MEGRDKRFAIYCFFTQEELFLLKEVAGRKNMAKFIQDLVLETIKGE